MANSRPGFRWSLVPLLAGAGVVSAIYTNFFMWRVLAVQVNQYPFVFFASLTLGLTLSAALWFVGVVSSWKTFAALVSATIAIHLADNFASEARLLLAFVKDVTLPLLGTVRLNLLATYFLVALFLYSAFLLALVPGRRRLWASLIALASASCAALTVAEIDGARTLS